MEMLNKYKITLLLGVNLLMNIKTKNQYRKLNIHKFLPTYKKHKFVYIIILKM